MDMSYHHAAALLNKSISRPALYRVSLGGRVLRSTNEYVAYFCNSATVPSRRMNTILSLGHESIGVTKEVPTGLVYAKPLTLNFIEPSQFSLYTDLGYWFDLITIDENAGPYGRHMMYRDDYVTEMMIDKLEYTGNLDRNEDQLADPGYRSVYRWTFHEAFPINIGNITLGSEMTDSYVQYQCQFTYSTYSVSKGHFDITAPDWLKKEIINQTLPI